MLTEQDENDSSLTFSYFLLSPFIKPQLGSENKPFVYVAAICVYLVCLVSRVAEKKAAFWM